MSLVDRDLGIGAAGSRDLGATGGVGATGAAGDDPRRGEQLGAVTDRGNRFVGAGEVLYRSDDFGVETQVFRRAAAGNDQRVVARRIDFVETGVQGEIVTRLFGVGLVALEIMDRRAYLFAGFLAGAGGMDRVACLLYTSRCV